MGEGLKIVNEIYNRAVRRHHVLREAYLGITAAVLVLSDPANFDLWERLKAYCKEEQHEP